MRRTSFRWLLLVPLVGLTPLGTQATPGCPFCTMNGQTLTDDVNQASMVLYGTLTNARLDAKNEFGQGSTDLVISAIIKKHEILGDKKVITLPRYVPTDKDKTQFLIFCDVYKGKIDPYRGVPAKNPDIVPYLTGALVARQKDMTARLRYFFDYLDSQDIEIANDAYKEFGNADYKDLRAVAKDLRADKVAGWLQDANTPPFRYGLYASILGHTGNEKHADLLRQILEDPRKRSGSGMDGVLAGYVLLKPKEGWDYLRSLLKEEKNDFLLRYAALRAVRFFWSSRPDVMEKKELIEAMCQLLDQGDIADLAIEDLRNWKCYDVADRVLAQKGKKSHDIPLIRRAMLRYALGNTTDPKLNAFVNELRAKDPGLVKDVEELLKLEAR